MDIAINRQSQTGMGSQVNKAIDAASSIISGIISGNIAGGISGALAPEIATIIKQHTGHQNPETGEWQTDALTNTVAHAILGGVMAQLQGSNALAGATGAAVGENAADIISHILYPTKAPHELSPDEKEQVSGIASIAGAMTGAIVGGGEGIADAVAGGMASKNAVENNYLTLPEAERKKQLETKEKHLGETLTEAERQEKADLEKKDKERQQVIKDNCSLGNVSSSACQGALQEAWITKSQYDDDFNYIIKYRELYRHDAAALNEALNGLSKEEVQHLLAIEAIAKESGRNVTEVATQYRAIMAAHGITSSLAGTHYGIKGNKIVKNKSVAGEVKGEIQQSGKASETTINKATAEKGNKSSQFSEHAKNEQEIKAGKGKDVSNPTVKPSANFAPDANPNLTVNMNQQNKHIVGTNEHKTANASASTPRSTIDSNIDVQKLVNNYAGTGSVKGKIPLGQPGSKENISTNQFIGKYYDHNINMFVPTKNFTIHYSKKGVHIVPARP
jgi:hypothetical protein